MGKPITFAARFMRNRAAAGGAAYLLCVVFLSFAAPVLFSNDPFAIVDQPFQPVFGRWLLGTDSLGRDTAAGLLYGGRTSIGIGLVATIVAVLLGGAVGALSGYYGNWIDGALMRLTEFFQAIPPFLFAIVLIAILSPSSTSIVTAIGLASWPPVARLVRGEFLRLRNMDFVQAAISTGMRNQDVILRQILPNALPAVIVTGALMVATAILTEAALSFLGLGDPNIISWGFMIGSGRTFLRDAWWLCTIPGVAIVLTVLSINLVADGLNDALDPRHAGG